MILTIFKSSTRAPYHRNASTRRDILTLTHRKATRSPIPGNSDASTPLDTMAAQMTNSEKSQQPFPFMELPAELRVMVYKFALQDTVDAILSSTSDDAESPELSHGALALLHTSKTVRRESCFAMLPSVTDQFSALDDACKAKIVEIFEVPYPLPLDWVGIEKLHEQYEEISRRRTCLEKVKNASSCAKTEAVQEACSNVLRDSPVVADESTDAISK